MKVICELKEEMRGSVHSNKYPVQNQNEPFPTKI